MPCTICKELARALNLEHTRYRAARDASYYLVTTELAAKIQVDMERAKSAWNEHRLACSNAECELSSLNPVPSSLLATPLGSFEAQV